METLLGVLVLVVVVGVLQVTLDRQARRLARHVHEFWLHMETGTHGPVVCDQDGRRLRGVRHFQYRAHNDHVDVMVMDVLANDGEGYIIAGRRRRKGPRP